jgi:hypothetical protein
MTALLLVHWAHVVTGAVWAGGQVLFALAIAPVVLARPAPEARRLLEALGPPVGRMMMASGTAVLWLGVARATWFGPVRSWAALWTPYGLTCLVALGLTIALAVRGARAELFYASLLAGDGYAPGATRRARIHGAVDLALIAAVLGCMVRLRFGL